MFEAEIESFKKAYNEELERRLQFLAEYLEKRGSIIPKSPAWSYLLLIIANIVLCIFGVIVWYYPTMATGLAAMIFVYLLLPIYIAIHEVWERKRFKEW